MSRPQTFALFGVEWPRGNSSHLFWNLEDPVLVPVPCPIGGPEITFYLLLYWLAFSINWFQCRCWAYAAFTCSSPAAINLHTQVSYLSCQWQWCWAEQTLSIWHWSKYEILPGLTQVKNKGRETWHTILQYAYRK